MKCNLVRIGNSRGVRLPKVLIEQAGLSEEVELEVRGNTIVIAASRAPREGWAQAAIDLVAAGGGALLDSTTSTKFDEAEWQW